MGTKNQYHVSLTIDGRDYGIWDKKTGGDVEAEITKHRPGAMGAQKTYGGQTQVTDITLTRVKERQDRDDIANIKQLYPRVGKANCVCVEQPLDADANPYGPSSVYTGKLMRISGADVDSESNDVDTYEIGISTNGTVA